MKTLLAILIVLIASASFSQTKGWKQLPGPYNGYPWQIEVGSNDTSLYVLTTDGRLFIRNNNKEWMPANLPVPFVYESYHTTLGAIMADDVGTLLYYDVAQLTASPSTCGIYQSSNNGLTWTLALRTPYINSIQQSKKTGNLYAFRGDQQATSIFRSSNHGLSWDSISSIPLASVDYLVDDDDHCYFSLNSNKLEVVRYDVKSNLYKALTSSIPTAGGNYIAYCQGSICARSIDGLYVLDNTETWQKKSSLRPYLSQGFPYSTQTIRSSRNNTLYTTAQTDTNNNVYRWVYSKDLGVTWRTFEVIPKDMYEPYLRLSFDSKANIYLGSMYLYGASNGIFMSSNDGASWKGVGMSSTKIQLLQNGPNHGIYAQDYVLNILSTPHYYQLGPGYFSPDGGKTWDDPTLFVKGLPSSQGYFGKATDGSYYYFAYLYDPIKYTASSSISFSNASDPSSFELATSSVYPGLLPSMTASTSSTFYASFNTGSYDANGSILATTDHGITWEAITTPITGSPLSTFNIDSKENIYIGYSPALYRSNDHGNTWTKILHGIRNASISSIKFVDTQTIIVGTLGDGLWHSTNYGTSWNKWTPSQFDSITGVEFLGSSCYAGTTKGLISCPLTSTSWSNELLVNEQLPILQLLKSDSGYLYASVPDAGIWTTNPNIPIFRTIRPSSEKFSLKIDQSLDHSPSITFALESYEHITLSLFDILGHKLQTISEGDFDAGGHQIPFSAASLANGMYCIVLSTPNEIISAKLLVNH